ncbi:MAG TPA: Holliday junction resolvase RuvX [Candidatus Omnitrophota bacterium]|nr:Holliday junction resolvase RuvX [Candidatus Omnitrophota bacterium]
MRIFGVDYGDKRIGIAASDPLGITAQGVAVIGKGKTFDEDIKEIKKIMKKFDSVNEIVVGLPKTMSGEIGVSAEKVLKFVEALKSAFKIPIVTWDERLTTVQAQRTLSEAGLSAKKQRKVIDKSAAAYILQNYMDSRKK